VLRLYGAGVFFFPAAKQVLVRKISKTVAAGNVRGHFTPETASKSSRWRTWNNRLSKAGADRIFYSGSSLPRWMDSPPRRTAGGFQRFRYGQMELRPVWPPVIATTPSFEHRILYMLCSLPPPRPAGAKSPAGRNDK